MSGSFLILFLLLPNQTKEVQNGTWIVLLIKDHLKESTTWLFNESTDDFNVFYSLIETNMWKLNQITSWIKWQKNMAPN